MNHATKICANCGAPDGLHHYKTNQCPKNGREEPNLEKKQEWEETTFEDQGIKAFEELAIGNHEKLIEALEKIVNTSRDSGREGCTYGDTKMDSLTVVYGYNLCLEDMQKIARIALKQIEK